MNEILGLVVYRADRRGQNRCLVEALAPVLDRLIADFCPDASPDRFWIDRYDLRGPHLIVLLDLPPEHVAEARSRFEASLDRWLADNPASDGPSAEEIEQRHVGCRGRVMCEADELPGMAIDDTYRLFEHPDLGHPFTVARGHADHAELWRHLAAVPHWMIRQVEAADGQEPATAALGWIVAIDRALARLPRSEHRDPLAYWRYHASTLIPGAPLEKIEGNLPALVGANNMQAFPRAWEALEGLDDPIPNLHRVVEILTSDSRALRLLREIDHTVLRALGTRSILQAPMVLYAWHRRQAKEGRL